MKKNYLWLLTGLLALSLSNCNKNDKSEDNSPAVTSTEEVKSSVDQVSSEKESPSESKSPSVEESSPDVESPSESESPSIDESSPDVESPSESESSEPEPEPYVYNEKLIDFEHEEVMDRISGSADDVWCWPRQISDEMAHDGTKSLLINPHPTDGTWPVVLFLGGNEGAFDISKIEGISLWVYNPSDTPIQNFGLVVRNGNDKTTEFVKTFNIESKNWQELTLTCAEIKQAKPNFDFEHAKIMFGNCGSDYQNRTKFYLDDFSLYGEGNWEPDTPTPVDTYDAATLADTKTYLDANKANVSTADTYGVYTAAFFNGVAADLEPSGANEWMGVTADHLKLGTNADGTAGVDEVRAEFTMTKDGYVLVRQMLLSWELDENVTVEFYLNDAEHKFASQTMNTDGSNWYSFYGAGKVAAGDKVIVAIKYHAANGGLANIVNKGIEIAECSTEKEFDLPEGCNSFDEYYKAG